MIFFVTKVAGAYSPKQTVISLQCRTAQGLSQSHPVFHLAGACSFLCHLHAQAAQKQSEYILLICFTSKRKHDFREEL